MAPPPKPYYMASLATALLFLSFIAGVASQVLEFPEILYPDPKVAGPWEQTYGESCGEGYGLLRCVDPMNCTAIAGMIYCCQDSSEGIKSKLSQGSCGAEAPHGLVHADYTCVTSIACGPVRTHYRAIIPVAKSHSDAAGMMSSSVADTLTHVQTQSQIGTQEQTQAMEKTETQVHSHTATATSTIAHTAGNNGKQETDSPMATVLIVGSETITVPLPPYLTDQSKSDIDAPYRKPMDGGKIGGTVVGILAGGSLLVLVLYLLFRRWKVHRNNRDANIRGLLPGPRLPTGSTVHPSTYRFGGASQGSDRRPTSASERTHVASDVGARVESQDIGLQYYTEPAHHQADGPSSSKKTAKEQSPAVAEGAVSPFNSPACQSQVPVSPASPADKDSSSTLHSRRSNNTIDWSVPKSTVSSPALLMNVQANAQDAPEINPLGSLSPFADTAATDQESDQDSDIERHRQEAYMKLSGEFSATALSKKTKKKKPGSVSRARQNLMARQNLVATQDAPKQVGSVARARQNLMAARDASEGAGSVAAARQNLAVAQDTPSKPGSVARARQQIEMARGVAEQPRGEGQNANGLRDLVRELDTQGTYEEINETGTVIRRKSKNAR